MSIPPFFIRVDLFGIRTISKGKSMMKTKLTIKLLREKAKRFSKIESQHDEPSLFEITDGKAVGTYLEHKFQSYLKFRQENWLKKL